MCKVIAKHIIVLLVFSQSLCRYAAQLMSLLPEDDLITQHVTTATTISKPFSSRDTHCK